MAGDRSRLGRRTAGTVHSCRYNKPRVLDRGASAGGQDDAGQGVCPGCLLCQRRRMRRAWHVVPAGSYEADRHPDVSLVIAGGRSNQDRGHSRRAADALALSGGGRLSHLYHPPRWTWRRHRRRTACSRRSKSLRQRVILVLTADGLESLLPTIVSRCQVLSLRAVATGAYRGCVARARCGARAGAVAGAAWPRVGLGGPSRPARMSVCWRVESRFWKSC